VQPAADTDDLSELLYALHIFMTFAVIQVIYVFSHFRFAADPKNSVEPLCRPKDLFQITAEIQLHSYSKFFLTNQMMDCACPRCHAITLNFDSGSVSYYR
jgi:hypothetical protein